MVPSDDAAATATEFATLLGERDVEDAAALLASDDAVLDSLPEEFADPEMDAVDALESYWYGLHAQYGALGGVEEVTVGDDGSEVHVDLSFAEGRQRLDLALDDGGDVVDVAFPTEYTPPSYADRDDFTERDVTVDAGDVDLDGVLAVPDGDGPFPGVLLVHGAGIHDPDGTAGASKILKDVAWALASEGIASLRYEKRLRDHEVPDEEYTLDAVVTDDAVAALDTLAAVDEVDAETVFVAGHSQGGMAAPRVADRFGDVAGVVNLDGPADPMVDPDDLAFLRYSLDPEGDLDEAQQEQLEAQREQFRRIADGDFESDETVMGRPGVWHQSVADCDPAGTILDLDVPAFVAKASRADEELQPGLADFLRENYERWNSLALPAGSRVEFYDGADHYFQTGPTPVTMEHLYFGGNVAEQVVTDLAEWMHGVADA